MYFLNKNYKLIIGIIIGSIIISGISVYASSKYYANQIDYTRDGNTISVENALNDLHEKTKNYKNLNTITTATSNDILNEKTAYDNSGNLITGKAAIIPSINIKVGGSSQGRDYLSLGTFDPSSFSGIYKYFKINSITSLNSSDSRLCEVTIVSNSNGEQSASLNNQYEVDDYSCIFVKAMSNSNGSWNNCVANITFYN